MKAKVREEILDAAEQTFAGAGVHAARMEAIAQRAGVAVGTLYNYFADREELLGVLLAERRGELAVKMDAALADSKEQPFAARLERLVSTLVEHFLTHWGLFSILLEAEIEGSRTAGTSSRKREGLREIHARLEQLVREGVDGGSVKAEHADVHAMLLSGMLRGLLVRGILKKQRPSVEEMVEPILAVYLHGVEATRS